MNKLLIATSIAFVLSQNIFAKEAPVENEQTRFESLSKLTKVIGTVEKGAQVSAVPESRES